MDYTAAFNAAPDSVRRFNLLKLKTGHIGPAVGEWKKGRRVAP